MSGTIFSIEEFSVYDGPGIRTSIFLKGCPLRCTWCHNPEGQSATPEIVRSQNGCIGCKNCEKHALRDGDSLIFTSESIKSCPRSLLRECGEKINSEALCERILKNEKILKMGGGVTFSGGEPLTQGEFLCECLSVLRGRLHTAVQTSGFAKKELFEKVLGLADYFLFDIKIIDSALHKKYTGVTNEAIIENFISLAKSGKDFVVRTPLIPTVTDTEENIGAIAALLYDNGVKYVELLPYNKMAGGKYAMLGRRYEVDFDESKEVSPHIEIFRKYGINAKIL